MLKMKKAIALLLMMILVIGTLSIGVFAVDYTITVTNPSTSSVSISGKTFNAYKLFDLSYSGDNYSYTISTSSPFYTNTGAKGVLDTYFNFVQIASDPNTMTVTVKADHQDANHQLKSADARALADALQPYLAGITPTASATVETGVENCTINTGSAGYYIVTGSAVPLNDSTQTVISAVILTNTKPTASVSPKLDAPTLDKKITGEHVLDNAGQAASAAVGQTVTFQLQSKVPDLTGYQTYIFRINDELTSGLSFTGTDTENVINGLTVKIGNDTLTSGYTISHVVGSNKFALTISYATLKNYTAGTPIVVTYDVLINENALNTDFEKNTATLTYSNNPYDGGAGDTNTTPPEETYVVEVDIEMDKFTNVISGTHTTKKALEGAEFKLFKGDTLPADDAEAWYHYNTQTKKVEWVTKANSDTFVTDNTGKFVTRPRGLEASAAGMAYGLLETKAPTGYNPIATPVIFTLTSTYHGNDNTVEITSSAGVVTGGSINLSATQPGAQPYVTESVLNESGPVLPETGGIGITIFYVLGSILVLGAGVVLVSKRKIRDN